MTDFLTDSEQALISVSVANSGRLTLAGVLWTPLCNSHKLNLMNYLSLR
ncbi:MAG: hypothetical protein LBQ86_02155 [Holophagales bacterium]|nr:hypothetical protein [Holophagales bacterium]